MDCAESAEQLELRAELRSYFATLLTPDVRDSLHGAHATAAARRSLWRQLGTDGMLGIGWPVELGGKNRTVTEQFIFFDEAIRAGAPLPMDTLTTVGSALLRQGAPALQQELLPRIAAGTAIFAIGYSEPDAGSDLSMIATTARLDGDHWVIDGEKVWTTGAHEADYIWLACRTDPGADKRSGLSIIIVPTDSDGFSWSPVLTVDDGHTTTTTYTDVRVPASNLVGVENHGWEVIFGQLPAETIGNLALHATTFRLYEEVLAWCADNRRIDEPWVQLELGYCRAKLDALDLLRHKTVAGIEADQFSATDAAVAKVFGSETGIDVHQRLLDILGPVGRFRSGSVEAALTGDVELAGRGGHLRTIRHGVNEIHRDFLAWGALRMNRRTQERID